MKKKIFAFLYAICLIIPVLMFSGCISEKKPTKKTIVFLVENQLYSSLQTFGNEMLDLPDEPTKTGYSFDGWYLDKQFKVLFTEYTYSDRDILEDTEVYAKFVINQYTIIFNTNHGSPIEPITQNYKTVVTQPADPTKVGYTFEGWYTDNTTFNDKYIFITMPLNGVTLYAKWNIKTYTITYHLDGGVNGDNPDTYTFEMEDITLQDATKEGCIFNGWYTDQSYTNKVETITTSSLENYNLYAKFTINQ